VIEWIRYDLDDRKDSLAELMAHVRLPLVSKDYLVQRVDDEPLIKESVGCKDFLIEAFKYHLVRDAQKKAFK
jgi:kelch-like protein 2/3